MARQLKRWESPRSEGRNHKGKGGSARQRQRKKQFQRLRATLKQGINNDTNTNNSGKGDNSLPAALLWNGIVVERRCIACSFMGLQHKPLTCWMDMQLVLCHG